LTQTPLHQNAPAGLRAWLESADAARVKSVKEVTIDGVPCVVKRRRPSVMRGVSYALRYVRAFLLGLVCKLLLGEFPRPGVLLRNGLAHEAVRLRRLLQTGCRVPEVWWQEPNLLVLEHVGRALPELLRPADTAERLRLTRMLAADLAAFHVRGLWHGGAQVRNVTVRDGLLWRIDFEENIGNALSLPLTQAYDLFQTLSSLTALGRIPDADRPVMGKLVLDTYFDVNPDPAVRASFERLARLLCGAARVLRPIAGWIKGSDVRAFFRVADTLRSFLR